jgi:hypothetical protein
MVFLRTGRFKLNTFIKMSKMIIGMDLSDKPKIPHEGPVPVRKSFVSRYKFDKTCFDGNSFHFEKLSMYAEVFRLAGKK